METISPLSFLKVPESPLSEFRFSLKAPSTLDRPKCEECELDMWLLDINPAEPGQDVRTFECAKCGASKSILCRSDR